MKNNMNAPYAGAGPIFRQRDIIPSSMLSNLIGKTSATLCIIGDSTSTDASGAVNSVDLSQTIWSALKAEFKRQNPGMTWNFDADPTAGNFGIGGSYIRQVIQTGTATALTLPAWFTDPSQVWLSYVQAAAPDVLVVDFGINFPQYGTIGTYSSVLNTAYYLHQMLLVIDTWAKVPNIIFLNNKVPNQKVVGGSGSFTPQPTEYYKAQSSLIRTFCRSNGNGFVSFYTNPQLKQFGLIDIARHQSARVIGYDYDCQYMSAQPSALASGVSLTTSPVQIGTSTDGDVSFTLVFPGQGGSTISDSGASVILLTFGQYVGNTLRLHFAGSALGIGWSSVVPGSPQSVSGPGITLPSGDLTINVSLKNEQLAITVNGNTYLNALVSRFVCGGPVTIYTTGTLTSSVTYNVTSFYEGFGVATPLAVSQDTHWGAYGVTSGTASGGGFGGNNFNHPGSYGNALSDYEVIQSSDLAPPLPNTVINGSAGSQVFTSPGSLTIPAYAKLVRFTGIGGGASGAGGPTVTTGVGTSGSGGGGGGSGARVPTEWIPISEIGSYTATVTPGSGGAVAAAGAPGNPGTDSTVVFSNGKTFTFPGATGSVPTAGSSAGASTGGKGGGSIYITAAPAAGAAGAPSYLGNAGAVSGNGTTNLGVAGGNNAIVVDLPGAGGAGGGWTGSTFLPGSSGNTSYNAVTFTPKGANGTTDGASGGNATNSANFPLTACGSGGGGGAGSIAGVGGNGGNGSQPGGGGGGGGSGATGGGTGGKGGDGIVVAEWC